jgi:hypothetical protein
MRPELITVERVSVLNRVDFFNRAPGHVLASVIAETAGWMRPGV